MDLKIGDLSAGLRAAGISRSQSDSVEWTARYPDDNRAGRGKYEESACYYSIVGENASRLKGAEVLCRPYKRGDKAETRLTGRLSREDYRAAVKFFKAIGIFPTFARASVRKDMGNLLCLPKKDWDRDTLYIALCHYRLIDTRPDLVWKMLRLWEHYEPKGLHPLQVFFYTLYEANLGVGHYCFSPPKKLHHLFGASLFLATSISGRSKLPVRKTGEGPYEPKLWTVGRLDTLGFSVVGGIHVTIKAAAIMDKDNAVFFGRRANFKFLKDNFKQFKTG